VPSQSDPIEWRRGFASAIAINLLLFTVIAIPFGEAIGFIHWDPSLSRLRSLPLFAVGIFVFTAWPEEFLFRGLLQNLLGKSLRNENAGWPCAVRSGAGNSACGLAFQPVQPLKGSSGLRFGPLDRVFNGAVRSPPV